LEFSYFDTPDQFGLDQGKSFVWIGFEELTLSPNLECYFLMFSTLRSPVPAELLPRKVRFTCNPSGPGHNAVSHRFKLSGIPQGIAGPVIIEVGRDGVPASRRMIFASFKDNVLLKRTEPEYMRAVEVACEGDPAKLQRGNTATGRSLVAGRSTTSSLNMQRPFTSSGLSFRGAVDIG
jgi:hypothetical protein